MWIVMNDSYISAVQDRNNKMNLVVRARVREDLENAFPSLKQDIIESTDSDYRFRLFMSKQFLCGVMNTKIMNIDYDNFKNSVKQNWRHDAYLAIWSIMYKVQQNLYWGR
tara:strand:+ start:3933 stop:4262 length:330 start_codon:yes stop_codon:yes gene_type:complete